MNVLIIVCVLYIVYAMQVTGCSYVRQRNCEKSNAQRKVRHIKRVRINMLPDVALARVFQFAVQSLQIHCWTHMLVCLKWHRCSMNHQQFNNIESVILSRHHHHACVAARGEAPE